MRPMTLLAAVAVALAFVAQGWLGTTDLGGDSVEAASPEPVVVGLGEVSQEASARQETQPDKQILFGDFHVHTTLSFDALQRALPLAGGDGLHPPADACDFARYCSALDFWSINDHAENLTPSQWRTTVDAIRQCNAVAGDPQDPDMVSFLGWEWSQIALDPKDHFGHKNVVIKDIEDGKIPTRPIGSSPARPGGGLPPQLSRLAALAAGTSDNRPPAIYEELARWITERQGLKNCAEDVAVRDLPADCVESATTPAQLFAKLDDWGFESIVIPHGTSWGLYTPPGTTWDHQLEAKNHDPKRQTLIEVYSGHGNAEEYFDARAAVFDEDGKISCPEPSPGFVPACHQAGEILLGHCRTAGIDQAECRKRAAEARQNYVEAGLAGHRTLPGVQLEEWLDAGQCRDCFLPAFNHRPASSVQYILAHRNFDGPEAPGRFELGLMASSDNHSARPGTGYKEFGKGVMTDGAGRGAGGSSASPPTRSVPFRPEAVSLQLFEFERMSSFWVTGGLIAVHSQGRNRQAIWDALERKEVYGTSGPRILLWFDLIDGESMAARTPRAAMGAGVTQRTKPVFRARALGSFKQLPGCPTPAKEAMGEDRLEWLCRGECYHPSAERKRVTRLEVVRIRPQSYPQESMANLIEDPWKVLPCEPQENGCSAVFDDPDYEEAKRDTLYYVRAIEEPSPAVGGGYLDCRRGPDGACTEARLCPEGGDCLAEIEERAWSSPIFVHFPTPR